MKTYNARFAKSIIWGIDAFHDTPKQQLELGKTLPLFFSKNVEIVPLSVLYPGRYNPEEKVFLETWRELAESAKKNIEKLLKNSKIPGLAKPKVIQQNDNSVKSAVKSFLTYALEENADVIAVSSHGRKGASRILLGSFAETLVLHSPLPVLVINPKWQSKKRIKHILFPTDFSDASKSAYIQMLKLAKELDCQVTLFHKTQATPFAFGLVVPPMGKEFMKESLMALHEKGASWAKIGLVEGVEVKFYLSDRPGYALDDILKTAKRHLGTGIIVMGSQSGPVESFLLGSLTRQVLRHSPCPVLTIHPHQEKLKEKFLGRLQKAAFEYSAHPLFS